MNIQTKSKRNGKLQFLAIFSSRSAVGGVTGNMRDLLLTLSRSGFFSTFWTGGGEGGLSNSENIKATEIKL